MPIRGENIPSSKNSQCKGPVALYARYVGAKMMLREPVWVCVIVIAVTIQFPSYFQAVLQAINAGQCVVREDNKPKSHLHGSKEAKTHGFHLTALFAKAPHPALCCSQWCRVWASVVQLMQRLKFPFQVMVWSWVLKGFWKTDNSLNRLSTHPLFSPVTFWRERSLCCFFVKQRNEWMNKQYTWHKRESGAGICR